MCQYKITTLGLCAPMCSRSWASPPLSSPSSTPASSPPPCPPPWPASSVPPRSSRSVPRPSVCTSVLPVYVSLALDVSAPTVLHVRPSSVHPSACFCLSVRPRPWPALIVPQRSSVSVCLSVSMSVCLSVRPLSSTLACLYSTIHLHFLSRRGNAKSFG